MMELYRRDDPFGKIVFPFVIALFISGQFQYTFGDGENAFLIMGLCVQQVMVEYPEM